MTCSVCGKESAETRPYGKDFSIVCYNCAMQDKETTEKMFLAKLGAALNHSDIVVLGDDGGPTTLNDAQFTNLMDKTYAVLAV